MGFQQLGFRVTDDVILLFFLNCRCCDSGLSICICDTHSVTLYKHFRLCF
jgi:hypothetical protein